MCHRHVSRPLTLQIIRQADAELADGFAAQAEVEVRLEYAQGMHAGLSRLREARPPSRRR